MIVLGKFGEHERSVRVARGALSFSSALQPSQVLRVRLCPCLHLLFVLYLLAMHAGTSCFEGSPFWLNGCCLAWSWVLSTDTTPSTSITDIRTAIKQWNLKLYMNSIYNIASRATQSNLVYVSVLKIPIVGSLSTRTFQATPPSFERLTLGRGLLRMTYPGLPTLCCRRRRELSGFGGVVKVVSDLSGS